MGKPRIKRGWVSYEVTAVEKENDDVVHFHLIDKDDRNVPFDYEAGQYLTFRFDGIDTKPLVRSYTMSSSPRQDQSVIISVKRVLGGKVSPWLCDDLKVGQVLKARGPLGKFCFEPQKDEHLFLIGAGSGVTPFVSIARQYMDSIGSPEAPKSIKFLAGFQKSDYQVCQKDIHEIAKSSVDMLYTFSREEVKDHYKGRISETILDQAVDDYQKYTFMTCGPEAMMELVTKHLQKMGVAEERIKLESFA